MKCLSCKSDFTVTQKDLQFLDEVATVIKDKKYKIPSPTLCPDCREKRRLAQGNQLFLYKRKCDLSGKEIISNHHPESPYKVYDRRIWFSDAWDPLEYGRNLPAGRQGYDFNRPFFKQFQELSLKVPRPALQGNFQYDENSDYTNYAGKNKDCYMIFDAEHNRDCYYSYSINTTESCMECYRTEKSELCFECIDCNKCYNCYFCQDCDNCSNSFFLKNCIGCKHCLMCSNLKNKEFYIKNKKTSPEEYKKALKFLKSHSDIENAKKMFEEIKVKYPQKYMHGVQNENVTGDYLTNCKNAEICFDSRGLWDCKYVYQAFNPLKNCMDIQECGDAERLYECAFLGYDAFNSKFSHHILGNQSDIEYCTFCPHSNNLFGCIGLRHKQYCILNKQYTKDEYEDLVSRIITHMTQTKEYGEFFPIEMSCFAYNETMAQWYFPLTKEKAIKQGYKWRDKTASSPEGTANKETFGHKPNTLNKKIQNLPETIDKTDETITEQILKCENCDKPYKIMKQEFLLLKKLEMPIPHECFFCRHAKRPKMRNSRTLYQRACQNCGTKIITTYPADSTPKADTALHVYCEKCYTESIT